MNVVLAAATFAMLLYGGCTRPDHARCPPNGFYTAGVHGDGFFECSRPYGCREYRTKHGGWTSECEGSDDVGGSVYCTGGSIPVTNDGVIVSCQARH